MAKTPQPEAAVLSYTLGNIDDYRVYKHVGRGKYSNVYLGKHKSGFKVVVKMLKPIRIDRINREVEILKKLRGVSNVVQLLDIVIDPDTECYALIMSWSENVPLNMLMPTLDSRMIAIYIKKLLIATQETHKRGIFHRDIKPGNIMFDPRTQELTLIDWGLAEFYEPDKTYSPRVSTRLYKGPELILLENVYGPEIDTWCIGCTLASMVFKRLPFFYGDTPDDQLKVFAEIIGGEELATYIITKNINYPRKSTRAFLKRKYRGFESFIDDSNKHTATDDAIDLIKRMLRINPKHRIPIEEALNHPFIKRAV